MNYIYTDSQIGEAHLCVKKNRIKTYPNNQVFLKDSQEFEIELFNPTQSTKLAKILINGKLISQSGIVLKPGQRVYLERYLDEARKFKFDTYIVDSSPQAQKAIANNGLVEVQFYDEYVPINWRIYTGTGSSGIFSHTLTGNCNSITCFTSTSPISENRKLISASNMMNEVETGRVEKGDKSNQEFTNYYGNWNSYYSNSVTIKILPISHKPLEINQLNNYCGNCGRKNKGGKYKFCPSCGTKF